jgi:hypothetical protein
MLYNFILNACHFIKSAIIFKENSVNVQKKDMNPCSSSFKPPLTQKNGSLLTPAYVSASVNETSLNKAMANIPFREEKRIMSVTPLSPNRSLLQRVLLYFNINFTFIHLSHPPIYPFIHSCIHCSISSSQPVTNHLFSIPTVFPTIQRTQTKSPFFFLPSHLLPSCFLSVSPFLS